MILFSPRTSGRTMNSAQTDNVSDERKKFRVEGSVFTPSNGQAPTDLVDRPVSGFSLADFVGSEVVQYLGVRSLVRFGASCKYHASVVSREVDRWKTRVADIEDEVVRLMADTRRQPPGVPTRVAYSRAAAASAYAMSLIDDDEILSLRHVLPGAYRRPPPYFASMLLLPPPARVEQSVSGRDTESLYAGMAGMGEQ